MQFLVRGGGEEEPSARRLPLLTYSNSRGNPMTTDKSAGGHKHDASDRALDHEADKNSEKTRLSRDVDRHKHDSDDDRI